MLRWIAQPTTQGNLDFPRFFGGCPRELSDFPISCTVCKGKGGTADGNAGTCTTAASFACGSTGWEILINDGTSYERPCDSKHQGKSMSVIYYCKNTMEQLHQLLSGLPESKIWVIHLFCGKPVSLEYACFGVHENHWKLPTKTHV